MRRLFEEFPRDRLHVSFGHEQLGDHFVKQGSREEAKNEYRAGITNALPNRSGMRGPDFSLIDMLIDDGEREEALERWQATCSFHSGEYLFPAIAFAFHRVEARVLAMTGDTEGAAVAARLALDSAAATRSNARNHPQLGLVEADEATLTLLRTLAGQ